jgi:hypothetical protein
MVILAPGSGQPGSSGSSYVAPYAAALVVGQGSSLQEMHQPTGQVERQGSSSSTAVFVVCTVQRCACQEPFMLVMGRSKRLTLPGSGIQGVLHCMCMTAAFVLVPLQDRFADNKDALQEVINEIVTLKELQ